MSDNKDKLEIVFATETVLATHPRTGVPVAIGIGTHWPSDDPVVKAYPKFFTDDARYGLSSSDPLGDDGYPVRRTTRATETADATPGTRRNRGQGTTR